MELVVRGRAGEQSNSQYTPGCGLILEKLCIYFFYFFINVVSEKGSEKDVGHLAKRVSLAKKYPASIGWANAWIRSLTVLSYILFAINKCFPLLTCPASNPVYSDKPWLFPCCLGKSPQLLI